MGDPGQARIESPEENVPFVLVVDCSAVMEGQDMLPLAQVLDDIKQALAARHGVEPVMVHAAIREAREEILHAVDAAAEEEDRRRG